LPLGVVLALAVLFAGVSDNAQVQGALRGMSAVAAGLIAATGFKLFSFLRKNVLGAPVVWALLALTFIAIAIFRLPLAWVLLGLGGTATLWANRQLRCASEKSL